jgi:hypothetical protein
MRKKKIRLTIDMILLLLDLALGMKATNFYGIAVAAITFIVFLICFFVDVDSIDFPDDNDENWIDFS